MQGAAGQAGDSVAWGGPGSGGAGGSFAAGGGGADGAYAIPVDEETGGTTSSTTGGSGGGGDEPAVIESPRGVLCEPCEKSADCPGEANWCLVNSLSGEKFCGESCESKGCPAGFQCLQVQRPSGESSRQCAPTSATCKQDPGTVVTAPTGKGEVQIEATAPAQGVGPEAAGVTVQQVALYQVVKIPLQAEGQTVTSLNAPIVAGRKALLRVFVAPTGAVTTRSLVARLEVNGQARLAKLSYAGASTDEAPTSSFNFALSPSDVKPGMTLAVRLYEDSGAPSLGSAPAAGRWPEAGTASPTVTDTSGGLKMTFVPIDINGAVGNATDSHVQKIIDHMIRRYPVASIPYEIRDEPLRLSSSSWSGVINELAELRKNDGAPPNDYYYGLVSGGGSGVQGISFTLNNPDQLHPRASAGKDATTAIDTVAHEIGHAMGRPHAPCGTSGEAAFPYSGASIGTWGYDSVTERLLGPATFKDMMSYCDPEFVSDYNYRLLAARIIHMKNLTEGADLSGHDGLWLERIDLGESGATRSAASSWDTTGADEVLVTVQGGRGISVTGYLFRHDHQETGLLLMPPNLLAGASSIEVEGVVWQLR